MAPKSKLKLALLAEKGVDLKKQKFLKQAKQATKKNEMKKGKGGDKEEGDWEDVDDEEKKVNGDADEEEESADEEEVQQVCSCCLILRCHDLRGNSCVRKLINFAIHR